MKQMLLSHFSERKNRFLELFSFTIIFFFTFPLNAQDTIQTTAVSVAACPGQLITIPVNVTDCNDVASISLKLGYDATVLVYQGYKNPHPALVTGFLVVNSSGTQVGLSWFSPLQSVSVGTGVLIEYQFTYLGGSCPLEWDTATSGNCMYSDINGNIYPDTYIDGDVSLLSPPVTITSQPQNVTITNNSNASFSVTAINATSYQWQESADGGMTWSDIVNGGVYTGSTTATLTLSNVPLSMDGYQYHCVVSGLCPPDANSFSATINVNSPLQTIITTIDSFQACPGDTIIVPVNVENFTDVIVLAHKINYDTNVLTYINHQNVNPALTGFFLTNVSGGNFSVSWFVPSTPATIPDGILYEIVFVYNGGDCNLHWDLSDPVNNFYDHISGYQFPSTWNDGYIEGAGGPAAIISQPHDIITNINSTATFSVIATGSLTYQWEESTDGGLTWSALYDGGVYSGSSTSVLTITGVLANMDQYHYRCVVHGPCNDFEISDIVVLTVIPQTTIITQAVSLSACAGSSTNVPIRVTELNGVYKLKLELYYSIAWANYDSFTNPLPELTSGALFSITETNPGIIVIESESYNLSNGTFTDTILVELIFTPLSNNVPLIWGQANSWYQDSLSNPIPAWFVDGAINTYTTPTADAGQDVTICSGNCTNLTASGGTSYLWDNSQTTASINVCPAVTSTYTVTVTDANGCTDSDYVTVTVNPCGLETMAGTISSCADTVYVPVTVKQFFDIGSFDLKIGWNILLVNYVGYQNVHNELLTNGNNPTFTYSGSTGRLSISWISFTGNAAQIGNDTLFTLILYFHAGGNALLSWDTATAGNCEYRFINGQVIPAMFTDGAVNLPGTPVVITSQPSDITVMDGDPASFSVTAIGATSYQWQVDRNDGNGFMNCINGSVFTGSQTSSLNIPFTELLMNGWSFRCVLPGPCTPVYTDIVILKVNSIFATITTTIDSVVACIGNQVIIQIRVDSFIDVASLSHRIIYDTSVLSYVGTQNKNPNITGLFLANGINGNFAASWFNPYLSATLPDGILYEIIFTYNGGNCCLQWDLSDPDNNVYTHIAGAKFPAIWIGGCLEDGSPVADAGPDQTIWTGTSTILDGTVTGGSGNYSYSWEPASLLLDATVEDPATLVLTHSTNFIFTVSDQVTGCVSLADTVLIVVGGPGYLSVEPTATPDTICNGNISSLQANPSGGSGTYTFSWTSNPPGFASTLENLTVSPTISTWYIITVDDGFTTFTDSVLVTVMPPPTAVAGPDVSLCSSVYPVPELIYYKFDGGSNSVYNFASSPVGLNPAPITGLTVGGSGQFGTALQGNGGISKQNHISTGWATDLGTNDWTISMWINNIDTSLSAVNVYYFFGDSSATAFRCFTGGVAGKGNMVLRGGGLSDLIVYGVAPGPSVVHFVYNGTDVKAYVNGSFNNIAAGPLVNINGTNFIVGGYDKLNVPSMNQGALLDEFRIYNRALSASEIQSTWNIELGNCTSLTASGGTSYLWDNSLTTASINVCPAVTSTYTVTVTDAIGCTDSDNVTVFVYSTPVADAGPDQTIAYGTWTNLNGTVTGGSGSYTYNWTPDSSLVNSNLEDPVTTIMEVTTKYFFIATDIINGCVSAADSVTIVVTNGFLTALPKATPDTICIGDSSLLQAKPHGGSGTYTFLWTSNPLGFTSTLENLTVSPTTSTWYIITVDDYFTTYTDSVLVTVIPSANAGPDATICEDATYIPLGTASGQSSLLWTTSGDGMFNDNTILNPVYTPGINDIASGSVTLTLTVTAAPPCSGSVSSSMILNIQLLPIANAGPDATICDNATYTLPGSATNQSSVLWATTGDGTFDDASILGATYTPGINDIVNGNVDIILTATATLPCGSPAMDNMTLTISPSPVVNLGNDTTLCKNDTIILYAGNPGCTYLWNTGETTASINVSCAVDTVMIYSIIVTNLHGCSTDASIEVTFVTCSSLDKTDKIPAIRIFPNPNDGIFKFQISNFKTDIQLEILNIHGQIIQKETIVSNKSTYSKDFDLTMLPKGIYFINFTSERTTVTRKLIIQ